MRHARVFARRTLVASAFVLFSTTACMCVPMAWSANDTDQSPSSELSGSTTSLVRQVTVRFNNRGVPPNQLASSFDEVSAQIVETSGASTPASLRFHLTLEALDTGERTARVVALTSSAVSEEGGVPDAGASDGRLAMRFMGSGACASFDTCERRFRLTATVANPHGPFRANIAWSASATISGSAISDDFTHNHPVDLSVIVEDAI